jgi:hypothetical protein
MRPSAHSGSGLSTASAPPLQAIASQVGAKGSDAELAANPAVRKELLAQLTATGKEGKLKVGAH